MVKSFHEDLPIHQRIGIAGGLLDVPRAIRWQMSSSVEAEKRLLYPLLSRCAEQIFGAR